MRHLFLPVLLGLLAAPPAWADDRDYCPERPGLDTPPCTLSPGRASLEVALSDWTLDRGDGDRSDTVLFGDTLARVGIAQHAEARIGWTALGHVRERSGAVAETQTGTGDLTLGIKRNLASPDGSGVSIALLPSVTLPTGGDAIGDGDWSAGLLVPISTEISDTLSVSLTPELDAAADTDRRGRHAAYGTVAGVTIKPAETLSLAIEAEVSRDEDPEEPKTQLLASASAGLMLGKDLQADIGAVAGLNHDSPDLRLYFGVAKRF